MRRPPRRASAALKRFPRPPSQPADLAVFDEQREQRVAQTNRRPRRQLLIVPLDLQRSARQPRAVGPALQRHAAVRLSLQLQLRQQVAACSSPLPDWCPTPQRIAAMRHPAWAVVGAAVGWLALPPWCAASAPRSSAPPCPHPHCAGCRSSPGRVAQAHTDQMMMQRMHQGVAQAACQHPAAVWDCLASAAWVALQAHQLFEWKRRHWRSKRGLLGTSAAPRPTCHASALCWKDSSHLLA